MAWAVLELRSLGAAAWSLFFSVYIVERSLSVQKRQAFAWPVCYIWICLLCLDLLPGREFEGGRAGLGADPVPLCRSGNLRDTAVHADTKNRLIAPAVGAGLPAACGTDAGYNL